MSVEQKILIGTIDLTPTWEKQVHNCLTILRESTNPGAISVATNELIRMGRIIDQHIHKTGAQFPKRDIE